MLNKKFLTLLLFFIFTIPLLAQQEKMFNDFKGLVDKKAWFEASELAEVLEIYYKDNPQFQKLKEKINKELSSIPFYRKIFTKYKETTSGLLFVALLSIIFFPIALRKGN